MKEMEQFKKDVFNSKRLRQSLLKVIWVKIVNILLISNNIFLELKKRCKRFLYAKETGHVLCLQRFTF